VTVQTGTRSIERGAQLLVRIVEEDEAPTVGELSQLAGLPKSTTSRLVSALERQGLVQRDPTRGTLEPGRHVEPIHAAGLAAWAIGLVSGAILGFRGELE